MARASGKVILLGEHAVVYGVPAIAAGLGAGAEAHASAAPAGGAASISIGERTATVGDGTELGAALAALLRALAAPAVCVEVELEVPPGAGLGASAAIAVATARAIIAHLEGGETRPEPATTTALVLAAADAWERVYHGNPSGIDAATSAHGGVLMFRRGQGFQSVRLQCSLTLAVAVAGPPASTRAMVEGVARLRERRPQVVDRTLSAIDVLVSNARLLLEGGELPELGKLLDLNHMLLSGLMLSTPEIERAVTLARSAGAFGSKLTGSGGGGAVIALVEDPEPVLRAWRGDGFPCFATTVEKVTGSSEPNGHEPSGHEPSGHEPSRHEPSGETP